MINNHPFSLMVCTVSAALLVLSGCSRQSSQQNTIQIKGSDTMVNLSQAWAEQFMKDHPGISVAVTGGGSGNGITSLISGTCNIAEVSREMKESEIKLARSRGVEPNKIVVALDGLAVIVHPSNPVNALSMDQLAKMYMGGITNWEAVGGRPGRIVLLSREVNSGTHVYFKEHVLRHGMEDAKEEFAPEALLLPSSQAIVDEVTQNPSAIGYLGMGYVNNRVKTLKISLNSSSPAVDPTIEAVVKNTYPIARPLIMYTNGTPTGLTKQFLDFVLSPAGQEIVTKLDFVPMTAH
jgi:phosphate transport system substrate-binding protein